MTHASYDVRLWNIEERDDARVARFRVSWKVAGHRFNRAFVTKALAESFRAELIAAARGGQSFDIETGLPQSIIRRDRDLSCYQHAQEFTRATWSAAAAKGRVSLAETLSVALPALTREPPGAPDPAVLRHALRRALNQNEHASPLDDAERHALAWLERASLPVSALGDPAVASDLLDALGRKLDGTPAAPDYFSRRRRVMHRVLGYAVRKKRLAVNPPS